MKIEQRICFCEDKSFINYNKLSPYLFIRSITKTKDHYKINLIDRYARILSVVTTKHYLTKFIVLDINKVEHLTYDFIKSIF